MDIQFNGANCISLTNKKARLVIDDNLAELGLKSITRTEDVVLFTNSDKHPDPVNYKLMIDCPGEYEVGNFSIYGIPARSHMADPGVLDSVIYKIISADLTVVVLGHIYPELNDAQSEALGQVDVLIIPVGGHGYTLDGVGALKIIRGIEPKLIIPTNYADKGVKYPVPQDELKDVLKMLSMEPKETVAKLKIKPTDLIDITQLVVLERV